MKNPRHIFNSFIVLLLCVQLFNICVYLPSWVYPGTNKADLTESVLELVVEGISQDKDVMISPMASNSTSSTPTINEEILEDLHPPDEHEFDLALASHYPVEHNYYHFTPDIKNHVLSVVSPPPDFC